MTVPAGVGTKLRMEEKRMRILVPVLMILAIASPLAGQTDLQEALAAERAALDSLKARLEADREQLEQAKSRQKAVSQDLERKERDIVRIRGELRGLTRRQGNLAKRLGTAQRELVRVDARRKVRELELSRRMREMYKLGRRGTLRILFSAGSFTEAFRRLRYLSRVAAQDRRDFEAIQQDRKRVSGVLRLQAVRHERQRALLSVKRRTEDRLPVRVRRREAELRRLRRDADARAEAVRKTQAAIAASGERIGRIIQETRDGRQHTALPPFDFSSHRGRLPRPAPGGVVVHFGRHQDPDLKTWTFNRGINIAAPAGIEVRAVAPGMVVLVDWYPGYGQFVLMRHPGGYYTLYGHLSEVHVAPKQPVIQAAVLGTVGSTGRIDGIPQLHFQIMRGEEPINPALWLSGSQ